MELLRTIRGAHVDKKRYTALCVAIARATPGVSENSVFEEKDPKICARSTWYGKWKHVPAIAAVVAACEARLRDWRDAETLKLEAYTQQLLRREISQGAVDAVKGLRRTALSSTDRADYRTDASEVLLTLSDDDLATRLTTRRSGGAIPVEVKDLDAFIARELARVADDGEAGASTAASPDADLAPEE